MAPWTSLAGACGFVFILATTDARRTSYSRRRCTNPRNALSSPLKSIAPRRTILLSRLLFNMRINPGVPIHVASIALADKAGKLALDVDRRDRGGTRVRKPTGRDALTVDARTLLQLLQDVGVDAIHTLKIDVEGAEDLILAPFFHDAPESMWPRLIL